jgi:hypothetical protein
MLPHGHQFSRDVMNDPANLPCNHVFCHECIMESLKGDFPSPHFYALPYSHIHVVPQYARAAPCARYAVADLLFDLFLVLIAGCSDGPPASIGQEEQCAGERGGLLSGHGRAGPRRPKCKWNASRQRCVHSYQVCSSAAARRAGRCGR